MLAAIQKSEGPLAGGPIANQSTEDVAIVAFAPGAGKELASLKASLAIAGHAVHDLASGGYLVVCTHSAGVCRECPDVRALAAFARQIGVRS